MIRRKKVSEYSFISGLTDKEDENILEVPKLNDIENLKFNKLQKVISQDYAKKIDNCSSGLPKKIEGFGDELFTIANGKFSVKDKSIRGGRLTGISLESSKKQDGFDHYNYYNGHELVRLSENTYRVGSFEFSALRYNFFSEQGSDFVSYNTLTTTKIYNLTESREAHSLANTPKSKTLAFDKVYFLDSSNALKVKTTNDATTNIDTNVVDYDANDNFVGYLVGNDFRLRDFSSLTTNVLTITGVKTSSETINFIKVSDDIICFEFSDKVKIYNVKAKTLQTLFNYKLLTCDNERIIVYNDFAYFVLNLNLEVLYKFEENASPRKSLYGRQFDIRDSQFPFIKIEDIQGVSGGDITFTSSGNLMKINFDEEIVPNITKTDRNYIVSGSVVKSYDGESLTELGFFEAPVIKLSRKTEETNATTSALAYRAIYKWTDANSYTYRSQISNIIRVSDTSGDNVIEISNPQLTEKKGVIIELYRAGFKRTVNGATEIVSEQSFKRVATVISDSTDNREIEDSGTELSSPLLYDRTRNGENSIVNGANLVISHNNSLLIRNFKNQVLISKKKNHSDNVINEFTGLEFITVFEEIKGLEILDDKLILFTDDRIYTWIEGQPLANEIVGDIKIGLIDENSIVLSEKGIFFKSDKGIYLLNRGLTFSYIGHPVENRNHLRVVSSGLSIEENSVVFLLANGEILLFNYFFSQWSVINDKRYISMTFFQNKLTGLTSYGAVYSYSEDSGESKEFKIKTGWFNFNTKRSYIRLFKVILVSDIYKADEVKVKFYYDGQNTPTEIIEFLGRSVKNPSSLEDLSGMLATDKSFLQTRFLPKRQKCSSIRMEILVKSKEKINITSLVFEYGGLGGINRPGSGVNQTKG